MTEEVIPAPEAASVDTIPPETPATTQAAEGEQQIPETPESTPEPEPKREPWYQKRIDELTKARREAERRAEALEAIVNQGKTTETPKLTTADPVQLAKEIAANERLNDAANRTYEAGKAAHPDFDQAVQQMAQITDLSQRKDFLEAVTSLPNAHDVYYHLGKNPDEAAHVLSLPPVRMAIEIANISAKVGRPKPQSKAPAPVTPIKPASIPSGELSDDLPLDEWMRRRNEAKSKKR